MEKATGDRSGRPTARCSSVKVTLLAMSSRRRFNELVDLEAIHPDNFSVLAISVLLTSQRKV